MARIVGNLVQAMETIAPLRYAAEWDNVGLLVGAAGWDAEPMMLTIDLTHAVLDEAVRHDVQMIIAYHPPIFAPLKAVTDAEPRSMLVLEAARRGIAIYSPHTALDAAPGGINDWLAGAVGSGDVRALKPHESLPETEQLKVVTFCPPEAVERLRDALAAVGAGRIGDYERCSFEIKGTGTFYGGEGTKPAAGKAGRLERVDEVRLEMVCPHAASALAVQAIRHFHPYEEPPIEMYALQPRPHRGTGEGRRVVLDRKVSLKALVDSIKSHLSVDRVHVAAGDRAPARIGTIGLCAGAGGSLVQTAIAQGCEAYITGEMRHHDVLAAQAAGCTVILAGHTNTERGYLRVLRKRLGAALEGVEILISKADADPLKAM